MTELSPTARLGIRNLAVVPTPLLTVSQSALVYRQTVEKVSLPETPDQHSSAGVLHERV